MRRRFPGWEPTDQDKILNIFKEEEALIDDPEAKNAAAEVMFSKVMFGDSNSQ